MSKPKALRSPIQVGQRWQDPDSRRSDRIVEVLAPALTRSGQARVMTEGGRSSFVRQSYLELWPVVDERSSDGGRE